MFMWKTLSVTLRCEGKNVLTVASSGVASLLLPGGRTTHSKFKIPVPTLDNSVYNIEQGSKTSELLKKAELIIWDEAPMTHKYCFEALDRTWNDIMSGMTKENSVFRGKKIVFGGDFRQILPVIPGGSRFDIVNSTINASYIWDHCEVLTLTKNMCLLQQGLQSSTTSEIQEFSNWIVKIGDGKLEEPNDGLVEVEILKEFLISEFNDPIKAIVYTTYPDLMHKYTEESFL